MPPTNTRGSRYKATCERGSIIILANHSLDVDGNHRAAADALCRKFAQEDVREYGTPVEQNPWLSPKIMGGDKKANYHVFLPSSSIIALYRAVGAFLEQTSVSNRSALRKSLAAFKAEHLNSFI